MKKKQQQQSDLRRRSDHLMSQQAKIMLVSVSLGGLLDLNGPNEDMIYFLP